MADPLVEYLVQQQRSRQAQNPFNKAAAGLSQMNTFMPQEGMGTNAKYGAIKAIAESVFEGLGERRAEQDSKKDFSDLTNALQAGDFGASPELSKFGQLYNLQQAQAEHENKLAQALIEAKLKNQPPKLERLINGRTETQVLMDPMTGEIIKELGSGERWLPRNAPKDESSMIDNSAIADLVGAVGIPEVNASAVREAILSAPNAYEARQILNSARGASEADKRRTSRPLNADQTQQLSSANDFQNLIEEAYQLSEQMADNRAKRIVKSKIETNSPEFKLDGVMKTAQQAFARARDKGALSNQDIKIYEKLFSDFGLLDSKQSIQNRINDARTRASRSYSNTLDSLKKGGFDVQNFVSGANAVEPDFNVTLSPEQAKKLSNTYGSEQELMNGVNQLAGTIGGVDEETAFKEAHKAKLRALRGK